MEKKVIKSLEEVYMAIKEICRSYPNVESCGVVTRIAKKYNLYHLDNLSKKPDRHFICEFSKPEKETLLFSFHSHSSGGPSRADKIASDKLNLQTIVYSIQEDKFYEHSPNPQSVVYVGRPFIPGSLDCFSLVVDYYKKEYNLSIPNIDHPIRYEKWERIIQNPTAMYAKYKTDVNLVEHTLINAGFAKVKQPERGDILLFKLIKDAVTHIGVYIGGNNYLHHPADTKSLISPYDQGKIYCIMRHKLMCN